MENAQEQVFALSAITCDAVWLIITTDHDGHSDQARF